MYATSCGICPYSPYRKMDRTVDTCVQPLSTRPRLSYLLSHVAYRNLPFKDSPIFKNSYKIYHSTYTNVKPGIEEISDKRIREKCEKQSHTILSRFNFIFQDSEKNNNLFILPFKDKNSFGRILMRVLFFGNLKIKLPISIIFH